MKWPILETLPSILISAFFVQFLAQAVKIIIYSIRDGKLNMGYATSAGGMPSTHAAFVAALSFSVGIRHGFDSDLFAICVVFSGIVVYDAGRLRRTVEAHSKALNRIVSKVLPGEKVELPEMVGHTFMEILVGIIFGGAAGVGITLLLMQVEPFFRSLIS